MKDRLVAVALAALAGVGALAGAPAVPAVEVTFQAVAPGVHAFIGETGARSHSNEGLNANIGLIVTTEGAVLVDSGASWQGAEAIHRAVEAVTGRPLRYVINTGGQDHRWLGNAYFAALGVPVIAARTAKPDMEARGAAQLDALRPVLAEKLAGTRIALPSEWVDGKRTLVLGGETIELLHGAGGHTPGDMIVWLPGQRVAFAGDIVYVDRMLGVLPVSSTRNWLDSFARLEALDPRIVVPGHGAVADLAKARRDTKDYLLALRAHMKAAIDANRDLQQAIESFDTRPFAYLRNAAELVGPNASRTYLEIEAE